MTDRAKPPSPPLWMSAVAASVVALVFLPGLWYGFVWDDINVLVISPRLRDGSALLEVFRQPAMWAAGLDAGEIGTYRPLALASFVVDFQIWGDSPTGFHATSLLLHCAVTVITFRFLAAWSKERWLIALGATLLVMTHPTVVEAVVWINGRSELFAALFGVSAMWRASSPRWRGSGEIWLAVLLLLAMLGKETGVLFIPLVFACRLIALGRYRRSEAMPTQPRKAWLWLVLVVGTPFVAYMSLRAIALGPISTPPGGSSIEAMVLLPAVWARSVQVLLLPLERGIMPMASWLAEVSATEQVIFALLALTLVTVIAWAAKRRVWQPALGLTWWLIVLLPVPLLVLTHWPGFHRWLFVGLPGIALVGVWLAERFSLGPKAWAVWAVIFIAFVVQTERSIPVWRDEQALFSTMLQQWPDEPFGYGAVGIDRLRHNDPAAAELAFRLALEKGSQHPRVVWSLARAIAMQDRCVEASELVIAHPEAANTHEPTALFHMGACFERQGRLDVAAEFFRLCASDLDACARGLEGSR